MDLYVILNNISYYLEFIPLLTLISDFKLKNQIY